MRRLTAVAGMVLGPRYGVKRVMGWWALTRDGVRVAWLGGTVREAEQALRAGR
jgi:hypothetical protein